jgi:hypothetical protein
MLPEVIVALLPKRVLPAPLNPASVIVALVAVKYTAFADVFALPTLPRLNPLPLTVARPFASTVNVAALL